MTASHTQAASGTLGKANMFLMTKEATDKDQTLKTQMLLSTSVAAPEKIRGEPVWKKSGYFKKKPGYERADLNIEKRNIPENTICYIN